MPRRAPRAHLEQDAWEIPRPAPFREAPLDQLRRLIREIHRRSLWQVLGIYVFTSWVVLQVIETLSSLFTLPGWFPGFALALLLIGFPVVLATAFVQEGIGGPTEREGPEGAGAFRDAGAPGRGAGASPSGTGAGADGRPPGDGTLASLFTWQNALLGGAAAFALWGVVAAGWMLFGAGPPGAAEPAGGGGAAATAGSDAPEASLAVLPFVTIGSDPDGEMLAAGVHEDLLTQLSRIEGLMVIARTSVQRYRGSDEPVREIARELGVRFVLEGSVQQVGERIRVTAQLIDPSTEGHLWADRYDRELTDVFAIQSEIARRIADELEVQLSAGDGGVSESGNTEDPEAYRHYVRGRFFWDRRTEEALRRAIREFEAALEIDPAYARAYAGLADVYVVLPYYSSASADEAFRRARSAAGRALELDPGLSEAHTSLALIRRDHEWDPEGAEAELRRALALNPGDATARQWLGTTLGMLGRWAEAVTEFEHAARLDPLSAAIHQNLAGVLLATGDLEAALAAARRTHELDENTGGETLARVLVRLGREEEALAVMEEAALRPDYRAALLVALGREDDARALAAEVAEAARRGEASPARTALAHVAFDPDAALDWLERAADVRDPWVTWMLIEPAFEPLHGHPRWGALRERVFGDAVAAGAR